MYNSKLYNILENFDKYEQNRCRKYIKSPYFNRSPQLIDLYEKLVKEVNAAKKTGLSKERLWNTLQPDKPYDDVRFRKYCSDLLKLVEGYLAQESFERDDITFSRYLMQAVKNREIDVLTDSSIRSAKKRLKKHQFRSSKYHQYAHEIEKSIYELKDLETKRYERANIEEIIQNLDIFFFSEKLRLYCLMLSRQHEGVHEYESPFIEEIIKYIPHSIYKDTPSISVYYQIYKALLTTSGNEDYFKLRKLIEQEVHNFPQQEAYSIFTYAINYCVRQVNSGAQEFYNEIFELYESLLKRELIIINDELSPWHFKNIVVVALRLKKYTWSEEFIKNYSQKLPDAFRENAITYNLAQVYFYQKKHDKVIEQLRNVEYEDVSYNLNSKAMLLATYYETDEIEPLFSLCDSFRAYLNRHKDIPLNRRKNFSNLIKFTKKLSKIMPSDSKSLEKLKQEISNTKYIASLNWLKEKIAELEGSSKTI